MIPPILYGIINPSPMLENFIPRLFQTEFQLQSASETSVKSRMTKFQWNASENCPGFVISAGPQRPNESKPNQTTPVGTTEQQRTARSHGGWNISLSVTSCQPKSIESKMIKVHQVDLQGFVLIWDYLVTRGSLLTWFSWLPMAFDTHLRSLSGYCY